VDAAIGLRCEASPTSIGRLVPVVLSGFAALALGLSPPEVAVVLSGEESAAWVFARPAMEACQDEPPFTGCRWEASPPAAHATCGRRT